MISGHVHEFHTKHDVLDMATHKNPNMRKQLSTDTTFRQVGQLGPIKSILGYGPGKTIRCSLLGPHTAYSTPWRSVARWPGSFGKPMFPLRLKPSSDIHVGMLSLTKNNLARRRWHGPNGCVLCNEATKRLITSSCCVCSSASFGPLLAYTANQI